ncbi:MAG: type IV pili methyl-accepting chemotaxis transducer N-terminal domain-containing protein, partial [Xenophilus sp.]
MNSIADKFKKLLPAREQALAADDDAAALAFDNVETLQPPEEKAESIPREALAAAPASAPVPFDGRVELKPSRDEAEAAVEGAGGSPAAPALLAADPARQQRLLSIVLAVLVLALLLLAGLAILRANRVAQQVAATGQSLMQSQRLAKSVSQALVGTPAAFDEVKDSADDLVRQVHGLAGGDDALGLARVGAQYDGQMAKITPLVERAERSVKVVLAQKQILTQVGAALRAINRQSSDLLEMAETVASLKMQQNATVPEVSAAGQLVMLTQRIGKSANEFLTVEGVSPDAVFLLGKDLNSFQDIARGLLDGSEQQRLPGTRDAQTREQLDEILKAYEQTRTQAGAILGNLQGLVAAREAQSTILADSEPLRTALGALQTELSGQTGLGTGTLALLVVLAAAALAAAAAIAYVQVRE